MRLRLVGFKVCRYSRQVPLILATFSRSVHVEHRSCTRTQRPYYVLRTYIRKLYTQPSKNAGANTLKARVLAVRKMLDEEVQEHLENKSRLNNAEDSLKRSRGRNVQLAAEGKELQATVDRRNKDFPENPIPLN